MDVHGTFHGHPMSTKSFMGNVSCTAMKRSYYGSQEIQWKKYIETRSSSNPRPPEIEPLHPHLVGWHIYHNMSTRVVHGHSWALIAFMNVPETRSWTVMGVDGREQSFMNIHEARSWTLKNARS